jgi:hypothetical protein
MKNIPAFIAAIFTLTAGVAAAKEYISSCVTLKDDRGEVLKRIDGGPPFVYDKNGRLQNQRAVELAAARAIAADPTIPPELKRKLISPETYAEISTPIRQGMNDSGKKQKGGGVDCCPCLGRVCECWGEQVIIGGTTFACQDATVNCRVVSPECPL